MTHYQPGDRIKSLFTGQFATVKVTPAERIEQFPDGVGRFIYMDIDNDAYPYCNASADNIERQPIEVGCWVRVTGDYPREVNSDRIGDTFKVKSLTGHLAYREPVGLEASNSWNVKHLARIADPEPTSEYLPGDRVLNHNGDPSTVVPKRKGESSESISLHIDRLPSTFANTYIRHLKRQPIEVGCRIRWLNPTPSHFSLDGLTVKNIILDNWSDKEMLYLSDDHVVYSRDVARIADPIKSANISDLHASGVTISGYDSLTHAQRLAQTLHNRHGDNNLFTPGQTLTQVLDQIDNMTTGLVHGRLLKVRNERITELEALLSSAEETASARAKAHASLDDQINKLASFIVAEIPGEPSASEGAIDTAIRIMRRQRADLADAVSILNVPALKRGDLVTWGAGQVHGRIVKMPVEINDPYEVIVTVLPGLASPNQLGKFLNISNGQDIRHSPMNAN